MEFWHMLMMVAATEGGGAATPPITTQFDYNWAANTYKQPSGTTNAFQEQQGYYTELVPTSTGSLTSYAGFFFLATTGSARRTDLGMYVTNGTINQCLWSRDLTNAAWVATNCSVAKDQTGRLAGANGASRVTVTASGGGTLLQSVTLASGNRRFFADIKRIVGTGNISMTLDGGLTWVLVAPTSGSIQRFGVPAQTLANPQVGFKFDTTGDQFLIDLCQLDDSVCEEYPTATTTASAPADLNGRNRPAAYKSSGVGLVDSLMSGGYVMYIEFSQRAITGRLITTSLGVMIDTKSTSGSGSAFFYPNGKGLGGGELTNGLKTANAVNYSASASMGQDTINRIAVGCMADGSGFICLNGGTVSRGTGFSPLDATIDHFDLGTNGVGNNCIDGRVPHLIVYRDQGNPSDGQLQSWTTSGFTGL